MAKPKAKWMKAAFSPAHVGEFTAKAKKAGFGSSGAFAKHVHAHPDQFSSHTVHQANAAATGAHISRAHARRIRRRK